MNKRHNTKVCSIIYQRDIAKKGKFVTYVMRIGKKLLQMFRFKPSKTRTNTIEYESKKWKIEICCVCDISSKNVDKNEFLLMVDVKKREDNEVQFERW